MICKNNKSDFGHGSLSQLQEGNQYEITEEKTVQMFFGKKKEKKDFQMVKVNGKRFEKRRFE